MRNKTTPLSALLVALAAVLLLVPSHAFAEDDERKSPLDDQPAVRNRLLLVKNRLELGVAFESTVNADFRHTVAGGLKLEYHITDMFSVGGLGFYGTSFNTGLTDRVVDTLPDMNMAGDPTPGRADFTDHLNDIAIHGALYGSVTPWYGKLAAFGTFFVNFDFYFQGGLSFAVLENNCCSFSPDPFPEGNFEMSPPLFPDRNPNNDDPLNDGLRVGAYLGGGIHVFLGNAVALDLFVRDYIFRDNPSGLDFDADLAVTSDDDRFLNHLFAGFGVSIFFPFTPERTP